MLNEKVARTVTVTVVEKSARKLIFLRHNANDYFSACEEVGCEWEGFLTAFPKSLTLPQGAACQNSWSNQVQTATHFLSRYPLTTANLSLTDKR